MTSDDGAGFAEGASLKRLSDDGMCFGCGVNNPIGLRLIFDWDGDTYFTRFTPNKTLQGWAGRVHGGIIALVLDEVLSRAALERHGLHWVTAELTTRLVKPSWVNESLTVTGKVDTVRKSLITCSGEVSVSDTGVIVAKGFAKLMRAK